MPKIRLLGKKKTVAYRPITEITQIEVKKEDPFLPKLPDLISLFLISERSDKKSLRNKNTIYPYWRPFFARPGTP